MKYINNWNSFVLNESKNVQKTNNQKNILVKVVDNIKNEYSDMEFNLYLITEQDDEKKVNIVINSIKSNPLSEKYKKSLIDNDRTVKYTFDSMYTPEFKEIIENIKEIILNGGFIYNDVILTHRLKNTLI